ncbi:MAG: hypothetical protein IT279_01615 [Ignavibacteriaceae bacterium]|nr:hypothetical protein [Ignavibacteriaceae bacterium]
MTGTVRFFVFVVILLIPGLTEILPQIIFREPESTVKRSSELDYLEKSELRSKIILNGGWKFSKEGDDGYIIQVPSAFNRPGEFIFEREFQLSKKDINSSTFQLHFLGLNYSAEVSVNSFVIYKHGGGEYPFAISLARDLLIYEKPNKISIKISSFLDSRNTLPFRQRFLNPLPSFGIFRDVYLLKSPQVHINRNYFKYRVSSDGKKVSTVSGIKISNFTFQRDTLINGDQFSLKVGFRNMTTGEITEAASGSITVKRGKEANITISADIVNPRLWTPSQPDRYEIRYELYNGSVKIDEINRPYSFYHLERSDSGLNLNNQPFVLQGVTYIPSSPGGAGLPGYADFESDLRIIKETGFNAVRIPMMLPHPYILDACERLGLLVFAELPLNSVPSDLLIENNYRSRVRNYLNQFVRGYSGYGAIAAIGFGTGYIGDQAGVAEFFTDLKSTAQKGTNWLTYASFIPADITYPDGIDFYGIEFSGMPFEQMTETYKVLQEKLGKGRLFVSEAGYLANLKGASGYINPSSFEAQAKYFQDMLTFFETGNHSGWFLHTMFDYHASYSSIVSGYNSEKLINYGILGESGKKETRLAYKVIMSKMLNLERVTIPIGIAKHDAPMEFIIAGILLAFMTGLMVNSGRKFREEALRALMRPYNFFSDVRDHRMISGMQTFLLAMITAGIMSVVFMSLLYNLKDSVLFEKFLLSFSSENIINIMSYLTRHPLQGMLVMTVLFLIKFLVLTIGIRLFASFVMNKVYLSHSYYITIWSFIPVLLLIPVTVVLYQFIHQNELAVYIYWALGIFFFWILLRILKGVYVIYDTNPLKVYGYGFLILLGAAAAVLLYYQINDAAFFFIMRAFAESGVV